MPASQIKSKDRVRDLAEVYTADREVNAMLDLLGNVNANITATYLEPACGNGNFLVAILKRKLDAIMSIEPKPKQKEFEFLLLQALSAIYGIDICAENVEEARIRMKSDVIEFYSEKRNTLKATDRFYTAVDYILKTNIQVGDMLNGTDDIVITEFSTPKPLHFGRARYKMSDMLKNKERGGAGKPFERLPSVHYGRLA